MMNIATLRWLPLTAPRARHLLLSFVAAQLVLNGAGCGRDQAASDGGNTPPTPPSMTAPYERGTWRLEAYALGDVAIALSHILVVHEGTRSGEASNLRGPNWGAERKVQRTRESALERAAQIALEAHFARASFEDLALRYSDDLVTRAQGGVLGTWTADIIPPEFLDALAVMQPGETSRVVETPLGFHVLKRRATPAQADVSAGRILIGYQPTAPFLRRSGRVIERTRDQAHALAEQVAKMARDKPESFPELVREYSDHSDVLQGGDIGTWSTLRSFPLNREVELLAGLRIGEVSEPIDSMEGFNVFMRSAVTERERMAIDEIVLMPTPGPDGVPEASELRKNEQLQRAVLKDVSRRPERFAHYQSSYCCKERREWTQGRGVPAIEESARRLGLREVAALPYDPESGVLRIVKRVTPGEVQISAAPQVELPAPQAPNIDGLVSRVADGAAIASYVAELAKSIPAELQLDSQRKQQLDAVVTQLVLDMKTIPAEQRVAALRNARAQFAAILGDRLYAQLRASVDRKLTQQMMAP